MADSNYLIPPQTPGIIADHPAQVDTEFDRVLRSIFGGIGTYLENKQAPATTDSTATNATGTGTPAAAGDNSVVVLALVAVVIYLVW